MASEMSSAMPWQAMNMTYFDNETEADEDLLPPHVYAALKRFHEIAFTTLFFVITLAMGCLITLDDIKKTLKRPWGLLIGMVCQFGFMPLTAFGIARVAKLPPLTALGLLIVGTSPGGTLSSIFSHWVDGDVTLSVCMTTASTIVAFGMMPLNLWIYMRSWTDSPAKVPYVNIVIMLALVLGPVIVGMLIKWKLPKVVGYVLKAGTVSGIAIIVMNEVVLVLLSYRAFQSSSWKVWLSAALYPVTGFSLGYLIAFICRQTPSRCRTIANETSCQNIPFTFALILLSFSGDVGKKISVIPVFFALFYVAEMTCITSAYVLIKKFYLQPANAPVSISANEDGSHVPLKDGHI